MLLSRDTKNKKYRISVDYLEIKPGKHEAKILKYKKVLTFYSGLYNLPCAFGEIEYEVRDNILYIDEIEFHKKDKKTYAKFIEEAKDTIISYFTELAEHNGLKGIDTSKIKLN